MDAGIKDEIIGLRKNSKTACMALRFIIQMESMTRIIAY